MNSLSLGKSLSCFMDPSVSVRQSILFTRNDLQFAIDIHFCEKFAEILNYYFVDDVRI